MWEWLLLLLPVAAASGWMAAKNHEKNRPSKKISQAYFKGLNFLLNEQPDQAVEVFIDLLDVNPDTVETHLALGYLFRKRGEVERAIRIHQNLIARPHLNKMQRNQALRALAKDYLSAGVLDRSERLFLDAIDIQSDDEESLKALLAIYQQEKNWEAAIPIAEKLSKLNKVSQQSAITHFHCELAEKAIHKKDLSAALKYLKKAHKITSHHPRILLIEARIEASLNHLKEAIALLESIQEKSPEFFPEALPFLASLHKQTHTEDAFFSNLRTLLPKLASSQAVLYFCDTQLESKPELALEELKKFILQHPSLSAYVRLLSYQMTQTEDPDKKQEIDRLRCFLKSVEKSYPKYQCRHCGFGSKTLLWLCPSCQHWDAIQPVEGIKGE